MPIRNKLTWKDIEEIRRLYKEGKGPSELGRMFKVDHSTIYYHIGRINKELRRQYAFEYKYGVPKKRIEKRVKKRVKRKSESRTIGSQYLDLFNKKYPKLKFSEQYAHKMIRINKKHGRTKTR